MRVACRCRFRRGRCSPSRASRAGRRSTIAIGRSPSAARITAKSRANAFRVFVVQSAPRSSTNRSIAAVTVRLAAASMFACRCTRFASAGSIPAATSRLRLRRRLPRRVNVHAGPVAERQPLARGPAAARQRSLVLDVPPAGRAADRDGKARHPGVPEPHGSLLVDCTLRGLDLRLRNGDGSGHRPPPVGKSSENCRKIGPCCRPVATLLVLYMVAISRFICKGFVVRRIIDKQAGNRRRRIPDVLLALRPSAGGPEGPLGPTRIRGPRCRKPLEQRG